MVVPLAPAVVTADLIGEGELLDETELGIKRIEGLQRVDDRDNDRNLGPEKAASCARFPLPAI